MTNVSEQAARDLRQADLVDVFDAAARCRDDLRTLDRARRVLERMTPADRAAIEGGCRVVGRLGGLLSFEEASGVCALMVAASKRV